MTLVGLNRAFVSQGLKILQKRQNLGIRVLSEIANVSEKISTYHLGFLLGPRINAGGRVGQANLGSRLLISNCEIEAKEIATKLNLYNEERQQIERQVLEEAKALVESQKLFERSVILVANDNWHVGVIGIVASRLKEYYQKPALVVAYMKDKNSRNEGKDEGKGSGRSVAGVHLGDAILKALQKGMLVKGGGHSQACGFTVFREKLSAFYDFLDDLLSPCMKDRTSKLNIDGVLTLNSLTLPFFESLQLCEPFGNGNPTPRFLFEKLKVVRIIPFGQDHLNIFVQDKFNNSGKITLFRSAQSAFTPFFKFSFKDNQLIDVVGQIKLNPFDGKFQIFPEDVRNTLN
jgi:single-stranded-DNA-specific exonuclease